MSVWRHIILCTFTLRHLPKRYKTFAIFVVKIYNFLDSLSLFYILWKFYVSRMCLFLRLWCFNVFRVYLLSQNLWISWKEARLEVDKERKYPYSPSLDMLNLSLNLNESQPIYSYINVIPIKNSVLVFSQTQYIVLVNNSLICFFVNEKLTKRPARYL